MHLILAVITLISFPFAVIDGQYGLAWVLINNSIGVFLGIFIVENFDMEMGYDLFIWVLFLLLALWNPFNFSNIRG